MTMVQISEQDRELIEAVAKKRMSNNAELGTHNKVVDTATPQFQRDVEGAAGELAMCRRFGIPWNPLATKWASTPDVIYRGLRYDSKATRYADGRLMVYIPKPGEHNYEAIDVFVLCRLHLWPRWVQVVGEKNKSDVMRPEFIKQQGYRQNGEPNPPTYFLPNDLLNLYPADQIELPPRPLLPVAGRSTAPFRATGRLTLEQLRAFLDSARAFSLIADDDAGYWVRLHPARVQAAFDEGLAPFCALERPFPAGSNTTYTLPRGTPFVPLYR